MKLISFNDESVAKRVELHIPRCVVPNGDVANFEAYLDYAMRITRQIYPIHEFKVFYTTAAEVQIVIVGERNTARHLASMLRLHLAFAVNNAEDGPERLARMIAWDERVRKRHSTAWLEGE